MVLCSAPRAPTPLPGQRRRRSASQRLVSGKNSWSRASVGILGVAWLLQSRGTPSGYPRDMMFHRGSRHREASPHLLGLPALSRMHPGDEFTHIVGATVSYLKAQWPQELATLRVDVVGMPLGSGSLRVPRWSVHKQTMAIRIYRHPIERLSKLHRRDRWHKRVMIESVVFSAVAEMLGTDPWHLAPERYHPH